MPPLKYEFRYRWLPVLAGGLIMGVALGIRHVQGLFLAPVTLDHGWSRETFGLALALQNLIWGIAQPFTGMIADRFGSARVIVAGMLLYALGLVTMAHAGSPALFTLGAGLVIGIALSGSAFAAIYGALSRMFPAEQRGWALGVAGAIGGLGQFCMVPVAQGLIGGIGWGHAFAALALVAVVLAPLAVLLRDRPASASGAHEHDQSIADAVREAFSHRGFWLLNAGFFACGFQLAFIATHLPAYLLDHGLPARHASIALALIALTNVAGTYACGHLGGLLRRKYVLSVLYLVRSLTMVAFVVAPLSPASVYAFAAVMGFTWLGTVPLTNGVVSQVFGVRYIATLFGFVFFGHQLGSFFGVWLGALVYDAVHSYMPLWIGSIVLGIVAALVHLPINDARVARPAPGKPAWA
ncbi:MFS transporter [Burkholderia sp. Ac-20353]|uniref:MFS transporter n=1 Tax=Burkholderia sp. Ac-20353 TaxID=2703894 RepID=UPI00197C0EE5|nr:MFS transporter [Burkholderia sp. Ac-20353]MBN3792364.1 MFS transporter [Burkholderia sp. Ac-20353]